MKSAIASPAAILLAVTFVWPAAAQDSHSGHAAPESMIKLPAICKAETTDHAGDMGAPMASHDLDAGHQALLDSMSKMHGTMMTAMSAEDVDVAFVCGMIPHHQGAIAMAKAVIEHGDDPWAKTLAQQVISAQEQEIADMLAWLRKQEE